MDKEENELDSEKFDDILPTERLCIVLEKKVFVIGLSLSGRKTCGVGVQAYRVIEQNNPDITASSRTIIMLGPRLTRIGCEDATQWKKYNMPLLEPVGMSHTGKNFSIAIAFMRNEQATTYAWVLHHLQKLYFDVPESAVVNYR
ncbi:hypothetical protein M9H77_03902 [Catharanthus roseus]|uniref:Uncharacterized protein n=1 Tax=Catharanthus roseus TaxID=4058 RepID=A0ACC0CCR0_CATRO|nr:hypothetical protein M9H77_03902 [Catharanthus roseus]